MLAVHITARPPPVGHDARPASRRSASFLIEDIDRHGIKDCLKIPEYGN